MEATWPLIGRDSELEFVLSAITGRRWPAVVLAGAAGTGKTRLAREALAAAATQGAATHWAVATRATQTIPLGAFARLVPVRGHAASPGEVLRQVGDALIDAAEERPLIVGVDDAHLLDDTSAALVHQLAAAETCFSLVTVRTGEVAPDPITALWKDGLAERVEIQALSEDEIARLLRAVLGAPVDGATLVSLWRITEGNVLFLREIVLGGLERGALVESGGVWSWSGPLLVSSRLLDVVASRLGALDDDERSVLEVVAQTEPVEAALVEAEFPARTLEGLERRDLLVAERAGRRVLVRLTHPLHGEAMRARTSNRRTSGIHRRLGAELARTGARRRDDLLRIATSHLEAGVAAEPEVFLDASRAVLAGFDHNLAERLARAAIDAGGGFAAQQALAEALINQGRLSDADALLQELERTASTDAERAVVARQRAHFLGLAMGRMAEADAVLARAEAAIEDAPLRDEVRSVRAVLAAARPPGPAGGAGDAAPAEAAAPDAAASVWTAAAGVFPCALAGRATEALALAAPWTRATAPVSEEIPHDARLAIFAGEILTLRLAGRLDEARALAEEKRRLSVGRGHHIASSLYALNLGWIAMDQGRVTSALDNLREAVAFDRMLPYPVISGLCLAALSRAEALSGDAGAAERALAESIAVPSQTFAAYFEVGAARAWAAAARGDLSGARTHAVDLVDACEENAHHALTVCALHDLARFGDGARAALRLAELATEVEGPRVRACAAHASGLAARDGDRLDEAAAAFASLGAHLVAAEAAGVAAAAHDAAGRRARALGSATRMRAAVALCEGARSPTMAALDAPDLTPREREIATLASQGLSNRDVAERLGLSVRTVEVHLQNVYAKLGVSGRSSLTSVLRGV